jgi:dipeptidyl aminopeptidase/acylaminoacyl peptidase
MAIIRNLRVASSTAVLLLGVGMTVSTPLQAAEKSEKTTVSPVAFIEMPRLDDPMLSADGKKIVMVQSAVDWAENERVDAYNLIDVETGDLRVIPRSEIEDDSLSAAQWAPDSSGFVATLKREDDEKAAAYFYDIESKSLTKLFEHPENVSDIKWTTDGRTIYFRMRRDEKKTKEDKAREIAPYDVSIPMELWRYQRDEKISEPVLAGPFSVRHFSLSADDSQIIYSRMPEGAGYASHHRELWLRDIATGSDTRLTENGYHEAEAQLSPDGTRFAFIATVNEKGEGYYEDNLFVQAIGSSQPKLLLPNEPMEVLDFAWNKQGSEIFILGNTGVRTNLFRLNLGSSRLTPITKGDHALGDWRYSPETDTHIMLLTDARSPGEVYIKRKGGPLEKVSRIHDEWTEHVRLPQQQVFQWTARDGTSLEGLLIPPVGYQSDGKYPLVTITHGGPRSSSQFGSWNTSRYASVLAGQGYAVFLPNHRGGTGYGDAFMRDMVGNYFRNSHLDVLDGIDALVTQGIADSDRLVKMGWSAGGHMTNKLITYTDRFRAASSGAGASSWISMYGESDVRHNRTPWFGGAPWQENAPLDSYIAQSPLKDAWKVKTPTLFFNGGNDVRVPPTQQIMMYRGVRAAGAPTSLYVAEGEPHGYRKPFNQLFKINTELAWYAKHVLDKDYKPVLPPIEPEVEEEDAKEEEEQEIPEEQKVSEETVQ